MLELQISLLGVGALLGFDVRFCLGLVYCCMVVLASFLVDGGGIIPAPVLVNAGGIVPDTFSAEVLVWSSDPCLHRLIKSPPTLLPSFSIPLGDGVYSGSSLP
jgi:hypothetical protein